MKGKIRVEEENDIRGEMKRKEMMIYIKREGLIKEGRRRGGAPITRVN